MRLEVCSVQRFLLDLQTGRGRHHKADRAAYHGVLSLMPKDDHKAKALQTPYSVQLGQQIIPVVLTAMPKLSEVAHQGKAVKDALSRGAPDIELVSPIPES